jgi:hypothetical protein
LLFVVDAQRMRGHVTGRIGVFADACADAP